MNSIGSMDQDLVNSLKLDKEKLRKELLQSQAQFREQIALRQMQQGKELEHCRKEVQQSQAALLLQREAAESLQQTFNG